MAVYGIREFKAGVSRIVRGLGEGDEVTITRHGKPCAKLIPVSPAVKGKPALSTLRGAFSELPDATYEDFLAIKTLWSTAGTATGRLAEEEDG